MMGARPQSVARWVRWTGKRAALAVALCGLGMGLVLGLNSWLAPEGPLIDLSQGTGVTSAAGFGTVLCFH